MQKVPKNCATRSDGIYVREHKLYEKLKFSIGDTSKFVRAIVFQNKLSPVLQCSSEFVVFNIDIESLASSKGTELI